MVFFFSAALNVNFPSNSAMHLDRSLQIHVANLAFFKQNEDC